MALTMILFGEQIHKSDKREYKLRKFWNIGTRLEPQGLQRLFTGTLFRNILARHLVILHIVTGT